MFPVVKSINILKQMEEGQKIQRAGEITQLSCGKSHKCVGATTCFVVLFEGTPPKKWAGFLSMFLYIQANNKVDPQQTQAHPHEPTSFKRTSDNCLGHVLSVRKSAGPSMSSTNSNLSIVLLMSFAATPDAQTPQRKACQLKKPMASQAISLCQGKNYPWLVKGT